MLFTMQEKITPTRKNMQSECSLRTDCNYFLHEKTCSNNIVLNQIVYTEAIRLENTCLHYLLNNKF